MTSFDGKVEYEKATIERMEAKMKEIKTTFDEKNAEYEAKSKEWEAYKASAIEGLVRLQGAYKALNDLLHAD